VSNRAVRCRHGEQTVNVDEGLVERVRARLSPIDGMAERKMFGGVAFLLDRHMCVGVMGDELIVRVGRDGHDDALTRPGTRTFDATGRPMRGWIAVAGAALSEDDDLEGWVGRALVLVGRSRARSRR
jgi:TfoX/Sxy family transcriptional regulator of competence genes